MDNKKIILKEFLEWWYCIIIALVVALIIRCTIGNFLFWQTTVKQTSMYPTLKENQRLIVNRMVKTFNQNIERGDIITFEAPTIKAATGIKAIYSSEPEGWFGKFTYYVLEIGKTSYIKRVIGKPGDKISIFDGKVHINGKELEEKYLQENVVTEGKNANLIDFTVPEGYIFAMGDNRESSLDCRDFGCIPIEKIESKVWIRFWPLNVFGKVDKEL